MQVKTNIIYKGCVLCAGLRKGCCESAAESGYFQIPNKINRPDAHIKKYTRTHLCTDLQDRTWEIHYRSMKENVSLYLLSPGSKCPVIEAGYPPSPFPLRDVVFNPTLLQQLAQDQTDGLATTKNAPRRGGEGGSACSSVAGAPTAVADHNSLWNSPSVRQLHIYLAASGVSTFTLCTWGHHVYFTPGWKLSTVPTGQTGPTAMPYLPEQKKTPTNMH